MKKYIANESGSTLVVVVLFTVILLTICLGLLSATIESGRRTNIRINEIKTEHESVAGMDKLIETFKAKVHALDPSILEAANLPTYEYEKQIEIIIDELKKDDSLGAFTIEDVTTDISGIDSLANEETYKTSIHTRAYKITMQDEKEYANGLPSTSKKVTTTVLLSPTPSFFQFVAGSESALNLHGGSEFVGDIFGGENVYLSKNVTYYHNGLPVFIKSPLPSIMGDLYYNNVLEIDASIDGTKNTETVYSNIVLENYYTDDETSTLFMGEELNGDKIIPSVKRTKHEYIGIDFDTSFLDIWNRAFGFTENKITSFAPEESERTFTSNELVDATLQHASYDFSSYTKEELLLAIQNEAIFQNKNNGKKLLLIDQKTNFFSIRDGKYKDTDLSEFDVILFTNLSDPVDNSNEKLPFTLPDQLTLQEDAWLIVDGDLSVTSSDEMKEITANLLVTGNLSISGDAAITDANEENVDFSFNSTIYALGKCEIKSTNISSIDDDKPIIIMCKEDLLITRINEFTKVDVSNHTNNILNGLFYTDKKATLYGVGSNFYVYGGIFAKEELTIQAIRSEVIQASQIANVTIPISQQINEPSRFLAVYNPSILTTRLATLPTVENLQFIVTSYVVE